MNTVIPQILLVEDDDAVRQDLASNLRDDGFAVWEAVSASDALAVHRQHHRDITLVVLAARLGRRQALVALRASKPAVRSCFLSDGDAAEEPLARGAVLVIPKPLPCLGQVSELLWAASLSGGCLSGHAGRPTCRGNAGGALPA
jgi:DNA-binding response OmpR family regulator